MLETQSLSGIETRKFLSAGVRSHGSLPKRTNSVHHAGVHLRYARKLTLTGTVIVPSDGISAEIPPLYHPTAAARSDSAAMIDTPHTKKCRQSGGIFFRPTKQAYTFRFGARGRAGNRSLKTRPSR